MISSPFIANQLNATPVLHSLFSSPLLAQIWGYILLSVSHYIPLFRFASPPPPGMGWAVRAVQEKYVAQMQNSWYAKRCGAVTYNNGMHTSNHLLRMQNSLLNPDQLGQRQSSLVNTSGNHRMVQMESTLV